jgi:hypothetical protein
MPVKHRKPLQLALVFLLSVCWATGVTAAPPPLLAIADTRGSAVLADASGSFVTTLRSGTYVIRVSDRSRRENFHLLGLRSGLQRRTTISFKGNVVWTLRLTRGLYAYRSDSHPSRNRQFQVR